MKTWHVPYERYLPTVPTTHDVISDAEFEPYRRVLTSVFEWVGLESALIEFILLDRNLWRMTFTDKSFDAAFNYNALEFTGDSELAAFIKEHVACKFPQYYTSAGVKVLSRISSNMVSKEVLANLSKQLGFWPLVRGRNAKQLPMSIAEDIFEAFVGTLSIVLLRVANRNQRQEILFSILHTIYTTFVNDLNTDNMFDAKTMLKELVDNNKSLGLLFYEHTMHGEKNVARAFLSCPSTGARTFLGEAEHRNKKEAEKRAAHIALGILEEKGYTRRTNRRIIV